MLLSMDKAMKPKVSCVDHASLVNKYYLGRLCVREDSLKIPQAAYYRSCTSSSRTEVSVSVTRRQHKRQRAAQRRTQLLQKLITQGKYLPLDDQLRVALQDAYERFCGLRFDWRFFLPSYDHSVENGETLEHVLDTLERATPYEILNVGNVHCNRTDCLQVALVNGFKVVLPGGVRFAQRDVRQLDQIALGKHKLIVVDPPWQNKSIRRGKQYDMFHHTELLEINISHIADPDECILAVWVTNRPCYMTYLREHVFPFWGFTFHACWYWLKVSKNGELVTPLDSTHRLPVETLVVGYRAKDPKREELLLQRLGEEMRIVLSIPLRHSWKPPPECFFDEDVISECDSKAELFARELRPNWTSVGYEVLKFQVADMFQPLGRS